MEVNTYNLRAYVCMMKQAPNDGHKPDEQSEVQTRACLLHKLTGGPTGS